MAVSLKKRGPDARQNTTHSAPNLRDPRPGSSSCRSYLSISTSKSSASRTSPSTTVNRDPHTRSPPLHTNEPASTSTPIPSNSPDSFQILHYAAGLLAENTAYQSDIQCLRSTLTAERGILSRLWHLDPSIPVGSLMHLVLLSQDRIERRTRLETVERACNSAKERVQAVEAREDILSTKLDSNPREQARHANVGPTRRDFRKEGLQRERTRAQAEIDLRERQMTELRDKLDVLDREEQEYWEVLSKSYRTSRTLEEREVARHIPLLRDPLNKDIQLSPEAPLVGSSNERAFDATTEEQDDEIIPGDEATLPEIPDSPSLPVSTLPVERPPISIPPIFDSMQASLRSNDGDMHWRLSATSNNTNSRSSAAESSIIGPLTPLNTAHDIPLPTIISSDVLEEETESIEVKIKASSSTSHTQQTSDQFKGDAPPTEQSQTVFRDSFTFPSFTIPPLATPLPSPLEREETFLAPSESAFTLVSHSAATVVVMPPPEAVVVADGNWSDSGNTRRFKKLSRMFLNPLVVSTAPGEPKADDLRGEEKEAGTSSILRSLLVPRRRTKSTTMSRGPHS